MERIGFIDITTEPQLYILERRADLFRLKDARHFSCTKDYEITIPEISDDIDEFYLSLPLSALNFRIVELPFSDKEKILGVLPFELDSIILNGSGNVILDGIILGNNNGKTSVLAVYIEKAVLKKIIERLKTFHIDPKVVTSVELNHILKEFYPEKILNPIQMSKEDRIHSAIGEIKNNLINLRRGELLFTRDSERTRKSLRLTTILGIAALILFAASMTLKIVSAKNEISEIQRDMKSIYSEVFPAAYGDSLKREDKKMTAVLYQFRSRMKEIRDKEAHLVGISPLSLLLNLANINRGNIIFNEITLDKERVALRGEAGSLSDIQKIKEDLSNVLAEVNISDSKTSASGRVLFTITAKEQRHEAVSSK